MKPDLNEVILSVRATEDDAAVEVKREVYARLELVAAMMRTGANESSGPRLVWCDHTTVRTVCIDKTVTVGRDSTCDLMLPNPRVSRRHCGIRSNGEDFFVEDFDSSNGTVVNGAPLGREARVLCDGDVIEIVGLRLVFLR